MSQIKIDLDVVRQLNGTLTKCLNPLSGVNNNVSSLVHQVDPAIAARRDIRSRLQSTHQTLRELEMKMKELHSFIRDSVDSYSQTENELNRKALEINMILWGRNVGEKALDVVEDRLDQLDKAFSWLDGKIDQGEQAIYRELERKTYKGEGKTAVPMQLQSHFETGFAKGVVGTIAGVVKSALNGSAIPVRSHQYVLKTIRSDNPLYKLKEDAENQIKNIKQVPGQVKDAVVKTAEEFESADLNRKAEMLGYGVEKVVELIIPGVAAVRGVKVTDEVASMALRARQVEGAAEGGRGGAKMETVVAKETGEVRPYPPESQANQTGQTPPSKDHPNEHNVPKAANGDSGYAQDIPKKQTGKGNSPNTEKPLETEGMGKPDAGQGSTPHEHRYTIDLKTGELVDFEWIPSRKIDPIAEKNILDGVSELKGLLSNSVLKKVGNFAWMKVDIEGITKNEFYAHSRVNSRSGNPALNDISVIEEGKPPVFKATEAPGPDGVPYPRDPDSEYKMFNDLANQLGDNVDAKGYIKLFTEKDTCGSCNNIISQFKDKYPNIDIEIIHNGGIPVMPKK